MTDVERDLDAVPPTAVLTARFAATPAPEAVPLGCGDVFLAFPLDPVVGTTSVVFDVDGVGVLLPSLI
jgi:hypothetical protein